MVVIPDLSMVNCDLGVCFRYFYMIFLIPFVILFLFWILRKTFVTFPNKLEHQEYLKSKKGPRKVIFWLRMLSVIFLIIAVASPFTLTSTIVKGNPQLLMLVDNSSSMSLYETSLAKMLYEKLEGDIPVQIRTIATSERSPLGDGLLNNIEEDDAVLMISDGQNTHGKRLTDIMTFAATINSSISTLGMEPMRNDVSVVIEGPSQVIRDSEADFKVTASIADGDVPYTISVDVDGEVVVSESASASKEFTFTRSFSGDEFHKITARLTQVGDGDYFEQNNVYYKTVKVVARPTILFLSRGHSAIEQELNDLYIVEKKDNLPEDLTKYMAIVVNNLPASDLLPYFDQLNEYVIDGNGLIVIGGDKAYDQGGYKGTVLETLLPGRIGAGEELNQSDLNVLIAIDISSGTKPYLRVERGHALSFINELDNETHVGAYGFGGWPCETDGIHEIVPIRKLSAHKDELIDGISRIQPQSQSCFEQAVVESITQFESQPGGKILIFISDGKSAGTRSRLDATIDRVKQARSKGIKVYTVGIGTKHGTDAINNELFLGNMANIGGGAFYPADESNRIAADIGEPSEEQSPDYLNKLRIMDQFHFITSDLEIDATVNGYNTIIPKPSARMLVQSNKQIPILVVWRFGLGRVVSLATDDGSAWNARMVQNKRNAELLTRSINWAIGDLSRKHAFDVTIDDLSLGDDGLIEVVSSELPGQEGFTFAKVDTNRYHAEFTPTKLGFNTEMGATYALNYPTEFERVGLDDQFLSLVNQTGGLVFDVDDTKGIIEFVKQKSKRIKSTSQEFRWPFLIGALVLFLIDIGYRKILEYKHEK